MKKTLNLLRTNIIGSEKKINCKYKGKIHKMPASHGMTDGMWRSPVSALRSGRRSREFKSPHPESFFRHRMKLRIITEKAGEELHLAWKKPRNGTSGSFFSNRVGDDSCMFRQDQISLFHDVFWTGREGQKEIIERLLRKIADSGIGLAIQAEELYLILDEAVTNAMEHGNKWDPGKKIVITMTAESDYMVVGITDEGRGFNTSKIRADLKRPDLLKKRGRGIYIINQFCALSWNKRGNQIKLRITRRI
jgi:serine/threonine-protein kinase RsbW